MDVLKYNECYCCDGGCGETEVDENGKSKCCGSDVFVWNKDLGVIVANPD